MIHIGEILRKDYEESGLQASTYARRLNFTRSNMYAQFRRPSIDTNTLLRISQVLGKDYFAVYSDYLRKKNPSVFSNSPVVHEEKVEYKSKEEPKRKVMVEIELTENEYQQLKKKM